MVTRARPSYTRDFLTPGICSLINPRCYGKTDVISRPNPHSHVIINRLFRRRSKKTSQLRFTGLCVGNSPVASEFPTQMASNAENVSIWWRHHVYVQRYCVAEIYFLCRKKLLFQGSYYLGEICIHAYLEWILSLRSYSRCGCIKPLSFVRCQCKVNRVWCWVRSSVMT